MSIRTLIGSPTKQEVKLDDDTTLKIFVSNVKGVPYVRLKEFKILNSAYDTLRDEYKSYAHLNAELKNELESLKKLLYLKNEADKDDESGKLNINL